MSPPTPTILRCLVYRSRATVAFSASALHMLELLCASRNHTRGIGGRLHHVDGLFIHVLEGPDAAVGDLFKTISTDPRHTDIIVLLDRPVSGRAFSL